MIRRLLSRWLPRPNPARELAMMGVNKRRLKYVRFHAAMAEQNGIAIPESWRRMIETGEAE